MLESVGAVHPFSGPLGQGRSRHRCIIKGQDIGADDLAGLMSLARNDEHISYIKFPDGPMNGLSTAIHLDRAGSCFENGAPDRRRVFTTRIIVGDKYLICAFNRDLPHLRPFADIAIAAATKNHRKLPLDMRPERIQGVGERIGRMGKVDEHRKPLIASLDGFEPSAHPFQFTKRRHHLRRRQIAGRQHQSERRQQILHLETTHQWRSNLESVFLDHQDEVLAIGARSTIEQLDVLACSAEGGHDVTTLPADRKQLRVLRNIGVQDGLATFRQQLSKKPGLRLEIGLHAAVIVEMIARQIGKGGGAQPHTVEAVLIETVAGGFQRQVIDTGCGQLGKELMQTNRIRRGQLGSAFEAGRFQPERA